MINPKKYFSRSLYFPCYLVKIYILKNYTVLIIKKIYKSGLEAYPLPYPWKFFWKEMWKIFFTPNLFQPLRK